MKKFSGVALVVLLVAVAVVFASPAGVKLKADSTPPPISCITFEIDGGQIYHQDFDKPLTTWGEQRAAAVRFAADLQLRAAITHEPRLKSDADRITAAVEGARGGDVTYGNVCYVLMRYCAPGCTGQGCMSIRVPSLQ